MFKLFEAVSAKFFTHAPAQNGALGVFTLALAGGTATFTRGGQPVLTLSNVGAPTWGDLNIGVTHALTIVTAAAESGSSNKAAATAVASKYGY